MAIKSGTGGFKRRESFLILNIFSGVKRAKAFTLKITINTQAGKSGI
jgi:hypothetical protein